SVFRVRRQWRGDGATSYNVQFSWCASQLVGPLARTPSREPRNPSAKVHETRSSMAKNAAAQAAPVAKKQPKPLTEEELLKAPEKDYMNEAQLAFFRQRLLELRAQLLLNADDTGQHLRENEVTTDPSDRATLEEEYTLELRTRDRERKLLK